MNQGSPGVPADRARLALTRALQLQSEGRPSEGLALIKDSGLLQTVAGLTVAGGIHLKCGNPREALRAFDAAVRLSPQAAEVHANRGAALLELGRPVDALAALDRSLQIRPSYPVAHFNRGNVLRALQRHQPAADAFAEAYRLEPRFAESHLNRGLCLIELHRPKEALDEFDRALHLNPKYAAALIGKATAYENMARPDAALAALDMAEAIEPGSAEVRRARMSPLQTLGNHAEALALADELLRRTPDDFFVLRSRAHSLLKLMRFREGLDAAERAAALNPQDYHVHVVRAALLNDMGQHEAALKAIEEARRRGAPDTATLPVQAVGRAMIGDPVEALADFDRALAIDPNNVYIYYNRSSLHLATGNWERAWPDFDERLRLQQHLHEKYAKLAPKWNGEPLNGKHLLIYSEQGHGDILQFIRFLRLIEGPDVEVTLVAKTALERLLAANFPTVHVVSELGLRRKFDYQISVLSLPGVFRATPATLSPPVPYISAAPERVARWAARVGGTGMRVGIIWQGDPSYARDGTRSIPLARYAPLAEVPGVRLFSVQALVGLDQLDALGDKLKITRFGEELERNPDGFQEMAAIMANMDLLIFSDTGPTHLAGAMGRPVWVALTRYPDWRWMRDREDTPWYPTMRLFRQETQGDWDGVFARIARELAAEVARRG